MKKTDLKFVDKQVRYSAFKVLKPKKPNDRIFGLSGQTISLVAAMAIEMDM